MLPVVYHHVVFTVPEALHPVFLSSRREAYGLLFEAVSETLKEVAANRLGGQIGFTAMLHTWTQRLLFHPHIHCIVPGGVLGPDGKWRRARNGFFLPVRVLSRVFCGKLLSKLESAIVAGRIPGGDPGGLAALRRAARKEFVIYSKAPVLGALQVLRYLARYTFKTAISNPRILAVDSSTVRIRYQDRARGCKAEMTLALDEFVRRFFLHVLPKRFVRVRHYGFLAGSRRAEAVARCRQAIGNRPPAPVLPEE